MIVPISRVRATDYRVSSITDTPFNKNSSYTGDMLSAANVTVDTGYVVGTTVYGGNFPRFYMGNMAFLSETIRQNPNGPPVYNIHRLKISVTIKDSSGNALNPSDPNHSTLVEMYDTPHDTGLSDNTLLLIKMYNNAVAICGHFADCPAPNIDLPQPATAGTGKDTTSVWGEWVQPYQYNQAVYIPDKAIRLTVQPDLVKPDVYTIGVTALGERGSCGTISDPTLGTIWTCNVEDTESSSYSFQYVYEADAGVAGDAGGTFSTARNIALGSYNGLLYGADTVDMYKFDASAGQNYYFNLVPPFSADFGISIYDSSWNLVVGSDLGTGRTNYGSFTATTTASWFLKIYPTGGSGAYSFSISTTPLPTDFALSVSPSSWTFAAGTSLCVNQAVGTTIAIQSFGGFSGNVYLSGSLPPSSPPTAPFYQPTSNPVVVPVGGQGSTYALIRGATTQPWGTVQRFFVTVTGTSGSLSHSTTLTVDVSSYCDMTPYGGSVPAGSKITMSGGTTVNVQDVRVGSQVIVFDVASGYQTTATITQILAVSTNSLLTLHTSAGLPFRADANPRMKLHVLVNGQPILKPITEIQPGDQIYNWDLQSWVKVTSVTVAYGGTHTMYDLVTDPLHSPSGAVLEYIANGYPDCPQACKA